MPTASQPFALPLTSELETRAVLKKLPAAHRALAELHLGDSQAAKEVQRYAAALRLVTTLVKQGSSQKTENIAR